MPSLGSIKQFLNMPSFQSFRLLPAFLQQSKLAVFLRLLHVHCFNTGIERLCYISSNSSRCSNCVLHHMSCSHSDDIGRVIFLQGLQRLDYSIASTELSLDTFVSNFEQAQQQMMASITSAYQSFVAFRQEFSRLQELRRQREQFSPLGSDDPREQSPLSDSGDP